MQTRVLKRRQPKFRRDPNPPNRRGVFTFGPLKFDSGRSKGKIVPTEPNTARQVLCNRCNLPSYRGLPPFQKALGFDPHTGDAIDVYVHQGGCPREPTKVLRYIKQMAESNAEIARQARGIFRLRGGRAYRGSYEPQHDTDG